jgi:short-subunit dehydrogenase
VNNILTFDNVNKGKIACITGANAGIGLATAYYFASKGYSLILLARRKDKLEEVAQQIKEIYPVDIILISIDVRDEKEVSKVFST